MKNYPHQNLAVAQVFDNPTRPFAKAGGRSSFKVALPVQWALVLFCCAIMGLMTGCIDKTTGTTSVTIGPPTKQPKGNKMPYFGKGATILATEYNAITMRSGDTVTLSFPCAVTLPDTMPKGIGMEAKGDKVKLWLVKERKASAKGGGPSPNGPATLTPTTVTVTFNSPPFTFMIYSDPNAELWPGDANADGYRNILDLYAIAQAIKDAVVLDPVTVASGCNLPSPLSYPPNETGDMDFLYSACAWGNTFFWDNQTIDYMHADCNMDGQINESDADYLRAVMDPMYLPEFLKSAIDGASLTAAYVPNRGGIVLPLTSNGEFMVRLPFDISFVTTPSSPFVIDSTFFGVAFSRPVAESPAYHLYDTRLDFANSGIFNPLPNATVWRQKFWPDFQLDYADGVCADATDRVLDVAAFRLGDPPLNPVAPWRIGQCQVTLDDILVPSTGGTPPSVITLIQHTVNGVVFVRGLDGVVVPQTIACSTDETEVDLFTICNVNDILLRDGTGDDATFAMTPEAFAWSSPDIWVRHAGSPANSTEHQQPINGQDEEVFVRVFNRSCNTSQPGIVDVYWTYANTHEKWSDFSQNHLDPVAIPAIPAYESVVVSLPWRPLFESDANQTACGTTLSLLAVVNSPVDGITLPQGTADVHNWVLGTNNVAMRSTLAIQTGKSGTCAMIAFRRETNPTKLVVEQVGSPSQLPASHYGDFIVQLNGYNGTPNPDQMTLLGSQRYRLDTDKKMGSLQLSSGITGDESLQISFEPKPGIVLPQLTVAQHYAFRVYVEVGGVAQNSSIVEFTMQ